MDKGDRLLIPAPNVSHAFLTAPRNSSEMKSSLSPWVSLSEIRKMPPDFPY